MIVLHNIPVRYMSPKEWNKVETWWTILHKSCLFLDLFAESPVGVLLHWNASKTPIVWPARVDTSLLWLFAYFAFDIFTLNVLQGPQVKVAPSLIQAHLAVTNFPS